jgi:phosphatidylglycerophosphate synthase
MNKKILVPQGISALRLAALPLFLAFFAADTQIGCITVFGLAQITDLIDGYVARKLGVATKAGAYFDAAVDFTFIMGIFAAFTSAGYYPTWIMLLITASFAQFVLTSHLSKELYDPIGKYVGSVLYISIGLTLLAPTPPIFTLVTVGFPVFAAASFATRMASFANNYRKNLSTQKNNLKQPQKPTVLTQAENNIGTDPQFTP